jgi:hypothetical protein
MSLQSFTKVHDFIISVVAIDAILPAQVLCFSTKYLYNFERLKEKEIVVLEA